MVTVSFPGLGLSFDINRVAFSVFGTDIYWYGVMLGIALICAIIYATWRSKEFGINSDRMLDVILLGAIPAIIGGRLYYVLCRLDHYKTFASWFDLRSGGIAMYGVLIGAFLGAVVFCKLRKVKVLPMFDIIALGVIMSQPMGRLANFMNQEAFGCNTTLPWGMTSSTIQNYLASNAASLAQQGMIVDPMMPVHPTFLYEALWTITGTIILNLYVKRRKFDGEIFLMYMIWYGTGRGIIESLRTDSLYVGPFRTSQLVAAVTVIIGALLLIIMRSKLRKNPDSLKVYGHTKQCELDLATLETEIASKKSKKSKAVTLSDSADETESENTAQQTESSDNNTKQ